MHAFKLVFTVISFIGIANAGILGSPYAAVAPAPFAYGKTYPYSFPYDSGILAAPYPPPAIVRTPIAVGYAPPPPLAFPVPAPAIGFPATPFGYSAPVFKSYHLGYTAPPIVKTITPFAAVTPYHSHFFKTIIPPPATYAAPVVKAYHGYPANPYAFPPVFG